MKCYKLGSTVLSTDYNPFFSKQHLSSLPTSFPSTLSYPTRNRFRSTRIQSRLTHEDPLKQSDDLSFYDLLGVTESVTFPEIKQAYKQLARKYHPDVSPPDRIEEYTDRFIRVQEAYETLSDPRRRVLYDRDLSMGFSFSFSGRRRNRFDEIWTNAEKYYPQIREHCRFLVNINAENNVFFCYKLEVVEEKSEWKQRWQSQLSGLRRRSNHHKDDNNSMSWAAKMRRQHQDSS